MPLSAGTRFGPYEVLDLIGIGGMGEVYRARDTRLDRTVALKVLPAPFAAETSARARFEREARAISALAHPHICTLHDVGEENGLAYLVMEHLRGETLAERLKRGPLPLDQGLEVGVEIADALAAAHRQGIVHRDLKPGNVVLTQTGVKLLDFGLARLTHETEPTGVEATASAETASLTLTARGAILGTMPYMAPEQLEGRPADARADIWALGAILYEMVTGTRAFGGRSSASVVAAILEREPEPLSVRQPLTPEALERAVQRCLAKSPEARWDSARDLGAELRWIAEAERRSSPRRGALSAWPRLVPWLAGGLALVAVAALALWATSRPSPRSAGPGVVRSAVSVQPAEALDTGGVGGTWMPTPGGSRTALAFTPDGRSLVFVGRAGGVRRLYVRPLEADEARALEGTEGARALAVSPDGRWVAFWAEGAIRRVALAGGPVGLVADDVPLPPGIDWGKNGEVVFSGADGPILGADPDHAPRPLTREMPGELSHRLPHLLPGGRALLSTVRHRTCTWGDDEVVVERLDSGERVRLLHDAADARYERGGRLVFLRRGVLHAAGFDPDRLRLLGTPTPVLDGVAAALSALHSVDITGAGQFAVSSTGALAWVRGPVAPYPEARLVAIDRAGRVLPLAAPTRSYAGGVALSPDGRTLAVSVQTLEERVFWLYDRQRGTLHRGTPGPESFWARWSPDGERLLFRWVADGRRRIGWLRVDGAEAASVLAEEDGHPSSWTPDGRQVVYSKARDLWVGTLDGERLRTAPLLEAPSAEGSPEVSPDGRWLAFESDASGRPEVYVQAFPGPGPRRQVSVDGGASPAWSRGGRELLFVTPEGPDGRRSMMAVDVGAGGAAPPRLSRPRRLFAFDPAPLRLACAPNRCYAVAPDGERFYAVELLARPAAAPVTQVELVQGFSAELDARLGADAERQP